MGRSRNCLLQLVLSGCVWAGFAVAPAMAQPVQETVPVIGPPERREITLTREQLLAGIKRMIVTNNLDEAERLLAAMYREAGYDPEIIFLLGSIAVMEERYDEAIVFYQAMLSRDPGLARVRLELARTYFLKGDDYAAKYHFQFVLAGELPPAVKANISGFLSEIRARKRWNWNFAFNLAPDTNINAAPDDKTTTIFGLPFELSDEATRSSGVGISGRLSGEYHWPVREGLKLRAMGGGSRTEYKGSAFDDTSLYANLGPQWNWRRTTLGVFATASRRWFGTGGFNHAFGGRIELDRRLGERWLIAGAFSGSSVRYDRDKGREGSVFSFSGMATYILNERSSARFLFGVARENTDANPLSNTSWRLGLGYSRILPWGLSLSLQPDITLRNFDEQQIAFGAKRQDRLIRANISLIKRDWTLMGFAPVISYTYTNNHSNIDFFSFARSRAEIGITREF